MFCPNCGKPLTEQDTFCPNCGQKIEQAPSYQASNVENKTVKLVIHRKKSFFGVAVATKIHIDGQVVASIKSDGRAEFDLAPGNHEVVFDMWSAVEKSNIMLPADCSTVYVEIGLQMGLITNKIKILSIRNEK